MPSSHAYTNGFSTSVTNGHSNGHAVEQNGHSSRRAENVGIIAMELYFPSTYVEQSELEAFDGVSPQKYTVGLGQERMGFCTDREDIVSFSLTVVDRLMKRTGTSYKDIGRLDVGTETLIDKSKSVKSSLMRLFEKSGNTDVEGVDNLNACYGGTAALFNCIDWVESSAWDGRYALVVAADIAVYATGNARCTGGAGAVAMLIGPQAAVVFDQGVRSSFMQHAYDFYKPNMASEYPTVDGQLSIRCYMEALDHCYQKYRQKYQQKISHDSSEPFSIEAFDYLVFHSPYTKLVQKSLARLLLHDFLQASPASTDSSSASPLETYRSVPLDQTYADKSLEKVLVEQSKKQFAKKTEVSLMVAKNVGNMYTASLYGGLASLLSNHTVEELAGKRVGFFSYGSGVAASLFSARLLPSDRLNQLVHSFTSLRQRLDQRTKLPPATFDAIMKHKEEVHHAASINPAFEPTASQDDLEEDVYYLESIDAMYRRKYAVKTSSS